MFFCDKPEAMLQAGLFRAPAGHAWVLRAFERIKALALERKLPKTAWLGPEVLGGAAGIQGCCGSVPGEVRRAVDGVMLPPPLLGFFVSHRGRWTGGNGFALPGLGGEELDERIRARPIQQSRPLWNYDDDFGTAREQPAVRHTPRSPSWQEWLNVFVLYKLDKVDSQDFSAPALEADSRVGRYKDTSYASDFASGKVFRSEEEVAQLQRDFPLDDVTVGGGGGAGGGGAGPAGAGKTVEDGTRTNTKKTYTKMPSDVTKKGVIFTNRPYVVPAGYFLDVDWHPKAKAKYGPLILTKIKSFVGSLRAPPTLLTTCKTSGTKLGGYNPSVLPLSSEGINHDVKTKLGFPSGMREAAYLVSLRHDDQACQRLRQTEVTRAPDVRSNIVDIRGPHVTGASTSLQVLSKNLTVLLQGPVVLGMEANSADYQLQQHPAEDVRLLFAALEGLQFTYACYWRRWKDGDYWRRCAISSFHEDRLRLVFGGDLIEGLSSSGGGDRGQHLPKVCCNKV